MDDPLVAVCTDEIHIETLYMNDQPLSPDPAAV